MPFPVTCPACGKSFSISDEIYDQKIKGRVVSVKCKQCQGAIRVDGTGRTSVRAEAPAPAPAPAGVPSPAPEATPAAEPLAPAPPPVAEVPREPPAPAPAPAPQTAKSEGSGARTVASSSSSRDELPKGRGTTTRNRAGGGSAVLNARLPVAAPVAANEPAPIAAAAASAVAATPPVAEVAPAPSPAAPPAVAPAPSPAAPPQVAPVATPGAAAPAHDGVLFAVDTTNGDRELTAEQIGKEIAAGTINADTLVWRDGMAEWLEVKRVPELAAFLKKPDPPKPAAAPKAAAAAPTGRFRPRQPTLPMGALPDRAGVLKPEAAKPEPARPEAKPAAEAKARAPMSAPLDSKRDLKATAPLGSRIPFIDPVPSDEEPTVLRSPDAVAALLSAANEERDDHTPVPPRLAAQLAGNRANPAETGPAPLPPFSSRSGSASSRSTAERPTPAPMPLGMPGSQAPASERRPPASGPKVSPIDTFRESPEAKRAWFPEPVPGQPGVSGPPPLHPDPSPSPPMAAAAPPVIAAPPPLAPSPPLAMPLQQPPFEQPPFQPMAWHAPAPTAPPLGNAPPLVASSAQPLSPPPAPAPPYFASSATAASVVLDDAALRPKRSKAALWIVFVIIALMIAGVVFVVLGAGKKPAPVVPPPPPAPAAEQPRTESPEPAPTAQADSPNPTETAASAQNEAPAPPTGNRDPLAEPTSPPTTNSGFADLFAQGAKRAAGGRFDPKLAKAAVDMLLVDASRCRERGGPTGITRVLITFEPGGTVSNAVAQDVPIAGTATAACIAQVFKRATIPAFTGSPGMITERISIQ